MIAVRLPREIIRSPLSGSIRARIVALGLIAAIPAVGMAGIIAGQDYRSRERVAIEHVDRLQGLAIAHVDVAVAGLGATLSGIAAQLGPAMERCGKGELAILGAMPGVAGVVRFDAAGHPICSTVAGAAGIQVARMAHEPWFRQAIAAPAPALGMAGEQGLVAVGVPRGGTLAALLPPDWFAEVGRPQMNAAGAAIWLLDATGRFVASNGLDAEALPPIATMAALQRNRDETLLGESAAGVPYAYASTRLPNGWQVIGAYRSTREHSDAIRVLYLRMAGLATLLLLGLAVTVLGADIAFGDPLRRLRIALAEWQNGAEFDARGLASAPTELVELAISFKRATVSLRDQRDELERSAKRQDLLMLEIHHRVKNNLQIIASLLNLQASRIRAPDARAEFQSARDRIRALATLHRHLYAEGEIHTINMPSFLDELCGQLFQAMGEAEGDRIKLVVQAAAVRLSTDQAVPLALIVTEAVTNAIKYGFPAGRSGTVTIKLTQTDDALDLVIADDGVGIPPGQGATDVGTRDGIGLTLIRGFSRQLGATLDVAERPGTRYSVHMPLDQATLHAPVDLEAAG